MAESNKKPRAERTKNNRELILEKSVELFRDKGYEQTTMADISRATGLTNGSIYHLFDSKQNILESIFNRFFGKELGLNDDIAEKVKDPLRHIRQFIMDYQQLWVDAGWYLPLSTYQIWEQALLLENGKLRHIDDIPTVSKTELTRFIVAAQTEGTIRKDYDAEILAKSVFIYGRGMLYQWSQSRGGFDLIAYSEPYWDIFLPGLLPNAG